MKAEPQSYSEWKESEADARERRVVRASRIADLADRMLVASASVQGHDDFHSSMSISDAYELAEAMYQARVDYLRAAFEPQKYESEPAKP